MTTRYRTTETTTWREVDGEVVALEMKESVYYSIGGSGNLLWSRLADGATKDELVAATAEYADVDEPPPKPTSRSSSPPVSSEGLNDSGVDRDRRMIRTDHQARGVVRRPHACDRVPGY
jgi:hypothetical protein